MNQYNYILTNCDTDSIMFCKKDQDVFTKDEQNALISEINSLLPEFIKYENDGFFPKVVITKAKNYVMYDGNKLSYKGSAFKSSTKEPALAALLKEVVEALIYDTDTPVNIYNRYIKEALNIKDISRWAVKKSITKKLLEGTRKNETKVLDAIDISSVREGDKIYLYNAIEGEIQASAKGELTFYKDGRPKMVPNRIVKTIDSFDGNYEIEHYVKRVYNTIAILAPVIDMEQIPKYHSSKYVEHLKSLRDKNE